MINVRFEECNIQLGKEQKEYQTIYAHFGSGFLVCCFKISKVELNNVKKYKKFSIAVLNFNGPALPTKVDVYKPIMPIDFKAHLFHINPSKYLLNEGVALFTFTVGDDAINELKRKGNLWVIVNTYKGTQKFQPIYPKLIFDV